MRIFTHADLQHVAAYNRTTKPVEFRTEARDSPDCISPGLHRDSADFHCISLVFHRDSPVFTSTSTTCQYQYFTETSPSFTVFHLKFDCFILINATLTGCITHDTVVLNGKESERGA